jgi:hypothetical protein
MAWDWSTVIAGLGGGVIGGTLTVVAGWITVKGARDAATLQVDAAQRAAKDQIDAVKSQIADLQAERQKTEDRRRSVIKWAVKTEGKRLEQATAAVRRALPFEMPPPGTGGGAGYSAGGTEQLIIPSSSLLRGEREDIALLDEETRKNLENLANALNDYNSRIQTARPRRVQAPNDSLIIEREVLTSLAELAKQAKLL